MRVQAVRRRRECGDQRAATVHHLELTLKPMDSPQWKPLREEAFMSWHASQPIDSVFGSLPCVLRREFGLSQYELRRVFREIGRIPVPSQ